MIIAVSDVHLGFEKSHKESFLRFLELCRSLRPEHFVLLGDILDFWRCNNARAILEGGEILATIGQIGARHVYYVPGNHDYYVSRLAERYPVGYPFQVCKKVTISDGGSVINFVHGHELEVLANLEPLSLESYEKISEHMCFTESALGGYASQLWDLLENRSEIKAKLGLIRQPPHERGGLDLVHDLAVSGGAYLAIGAKPGEKLVYGHTHRPFINAERTVANTGSWITEEPADRPRDTYVKIVDGQMELRHFGKDPFP